MSQLVRRDVIDGVPVFWIPDAPRRVGSLQFRAGRSDETFTTTGVTHLVEHLTLYPFGRRPYSSNGFVDHFRAVFHAGGSEADVLRNFADVTASLAALPLDRLPAEARVLRTEGMSRGAHLAGELLWYRYGPNGVGLMAVPEFGLHGIDGETVAAWSASRFTRDNAAAWYSGPLPPGLHFGLPEGRRHPCVPRVELEGLPRPAWIPAQIAGIGLGLVVERTTAAVMALRTLTNRLERRLRFDQGQSYEVSLAYIPLDGTEAHASVFASSLDSEAAAVRDHFLAVVNAFAAEGPSPDEMAFDIDAVARWHEDPDSLYEELDAAVQSELFGVDPDPFPKLLAELRETTREQAREALARGLARAFLIDGVGHAPFSGGWFGYPMRSASILHGRRLDTIQRRFPWQRRSEQLIVGSDGVSWLGDDGLGLTVRYADCVGLVVEGPLRTLYGGDGFVVRVHADYWRGGQAVVREIDAAVPASRVVRINHASGS